MGETKIVLLVEDEPNIMEALRFVLERDDWHVLTHSDGATALGVITDTAPDVVVLDVMLPNKSGFDILRELRGGGNTVPVLMLTARGQQKDRDMAIESGANRFITKPFANRDVRDALNTLIAK